LLTEEPELGVLDPFVVILPPIPGFCATSVGVWEGMAAGLLTEEPGLVDPFAALLLPPTPGFCVMLTSWLPSGMGPDGFAGQEPAGETGAFIPNGIVPL